MEFAQSVSDQTFSDIRAFLSADNLELGRAIIDYRGVRIDLDLDLKPGAPLVVVLQGAKPETIKPPYLGGRSLMEGLTASRISIADPSLMLDPRLNLAWYCGSISQPDLQDVLVDIVKKVAVISGAPKCIFLGGSGGGFASLVLATRFENSTAVVWNPQTDVERYNQQHVETYFQTCWHGRRDVAKRCISTTVLPLYQESVSNQVVYFQSETDTWHITDHLNPFIDVRKPRTEFWLKVDNWGNGHIPPPRDMILSSLSAVLTDDSGVLEAEGFKLQSS